MAQFEEASEMSPFPSGRVRSRLINWENTRGLNGKAGDTRDHPIHAGDYSLATDICPVPERADNRREGREASD